MKMQHGANIYKYAKHLHCSEDEILDFSSNINSYHPNVTITATNTMLVRYADNSYQSLKESIKQRYSVKKSQIALFNGATSAIYSLLESLKEKKVYLYAPLYGEYEKACGDKELIKIDRFKKINIKPKKNSIVIFVNPSTPEGRFYDLKKLMRLWRKQKCTIILDESFLEFENLASQRAKINSYKKLFIIQSFSKFYSCAGVRVGAIFSDKKNIKKLKAPLWNLSSFDTEFLQKRLLDKKFQKRSLKLHKKKKKELYKILRKSRLFSKIYRSDANFFLVKSKSAQKIFNTLLKEKILVRDCASFDYLTDKYLRFGVKDSSMHKKLEKGLKLCQISS